MSKRPRRKAGKRIAPGRIFASPALESAPPALRRFPLAWALLGGGLVIGLVLWLRFGRGDAAHSEKRPNPAPQVDAKKERNPSPAKKPAEDKTKDPGDTFLDAFGKKDGGDGQPDGAILANSDLEKNFQTLLDLKDRLLALVRKVGKRAEGEELNERYNKGLAAFEKELAGARKARPDDPVPAWLSGELLILVGGEPEEILPHLHRAVKRGLKRPRLFASLARAQIETNQLEEAFQSAAKALDLDGKGRYAWNAFTRAAFNTERFAEVIARLDRSFQATKPDWAAPMRATAVAWQGRWEAEQKLRAAEKRADDLPRVRLTIEHRRFGRDGGGQLTKIETTGKGTIVLELFEDQAPATVANFLSLVEQKRYDGTRLFAAEAAMLVAGGDPKSKTGDAADDGTGGPGYVIPDEFNLPGARGHFRGSIGMGNQGPATTGSLFFLTFAPHLEMDGNYTVFGRVIQGLDVLDRITLGRTNPRVGRYGRLIPGDLLVRAEVVRKRAHEYKVIKLQPK